jgi:hypothetical protein
MTSNSTWLGGLRMVYPVHPRQPPQAHRGPMRHRRLPAGRQPLKQAPPRQRRHPLRHVHPVSDALVSQR